MRRRRARRTATSTCCRSRSAGTTRDDGRCARSTTACSGSAFRESTSSTFTTSRGTRTAPSIASRFREAMEGAVPALTELRSEGAIAGFGLGVNEWEVCVEALAHADLDVLLLAGRYTLADQTALPQLLPLCVARNVRVVIGGSVQFRHSRQRREAARRARAVLQLSARAPRTSSPVSRRSRPYARRTRYRSRLRRCSFRSRIRRWPASRRACERLRSSTKTSRCRTARSPALSGAICAQKALIAVDSSAARRRTR